jgi:hypothetical protein
MLNLAANTILFNISGDKLHAAIESSLRTSAQKWREFKGLPDFPLERVTTKNTF